MRGSDAPRRAAAAYAAAEATKDPRTKLALLGVARLWEQLARPGVPYSFTPHHQQLAAFKEELVVAVTIVPPQRPAPPRRPSPSAVRIPDAVTIEF